MGYIKVSLVQPTYTATVTFSLEHGGEKSSLSGLASQLGFSSGGNGGMFTGENVLKLMKSRRLIQDVLLSPVEINDDEVLLINRFIQTLPKLKESWESIGLYPFQTDEKISRTQDSAIGVIFEMVSDESLLVTKQDDAVGIVTLSYSGHDEAFVGSFAEQLTAQATKFYVESKMVNLRSNLNKLQIRVDSVSAALQVAMVGYAKAQDQNSYTVISAAKVPTTQKELKVTMLTTLYSELIKNLELTKTMAAREEPIISIIDRPHYPLRVRDSKVKFGLLSGLIGGFLAVMFFTSKKFLSELNKQAKLLNTRN